MTEKVKELRELIAWLVSDDTGLSSRTLAAETAGVEPVRKHWPSISYPLDPADLGRCLRLIERIPAARKAVDRIAAKHPVWAKLAPEWDRLSELYNEERPSGRCPKTYDAMKALGC
jgi:hypothetical protein